MTSRRGDAWTDFELQCLYDVINDDDWFRHASRLIFRSEKAIRTKMSLLRSEAGITVRHAGHREPARQTVLGDAVSGSQALRAAIFAIHAPPKPAPLREPAQLDFLPGPLFEFSEAA